MINQSIKFFTIFLLVFNVFAGGDDRDEEYYENLDEELAAFEAQLAEDLANQAALEAFQQKLADEKAAAASSGARSIGSAVSPSPKPAAPKPDTSQVRAMSAPTAPKPSASPIKSPRLAAALNSVSKFKSENYDAMVRYMVGEGYAPNEEAAKAIVEHMSDDWVIDLMG